MIVRSLLVAGAFIGSRRNPNEDGKSMDDGEAESDDGNNDPAFLGSSR